MKCEIIAKIYNGFTEKFGLPRQSGLTEARSVIIFEPKYRNADALRGVEEYSHLWLIWQFSGFERQKWSPTVRPPRLGGNKRMGVFATRSPNRPNPIGLSVVKVEKIELSGPDGPSITVSGADLMNETAILDIKPYLPYADSVPEATNGFAGEHLQYALQVQVADEKLDVLSEEDKKVVFGLLSQDPRPAYQNDPTRVYSMTYKKYTVRFTVCEKVLNVLEIICEDAP